MNKAEIRPLLVEALERATMEERRAFQATQEGAPERDWNRLASLQEAWKFSRLQRAQAELQLWLADRQWEREETEEETLELTDKG
jgi:hypothetical protein